MEEEGKSIDYFFLFLEFLLFQVLDFLHSDPTKLEAVLPP